MLICSLFLYGTSMSLLNCVPAWSTCQLLIVMCQRANKRAKGVPIIQLGEPTCQGAKGVPIIQLGLPTCQRVVNYSTWHADVPKACQVFSFACQKAYQFFIYFLKEFFYFWIFQLRLKAPEHEYIFSKYSRNLNISEIFWVCYTKNSFPIIFRPNIYEL